MGRYQQIVDLLQSSIPEYAALTIVPRGTPLFPDLLMTGQMRFGRRTGSNFSVMNPDNQVLLTAATTAQQLIFPISRNLQWFEMGALLTFNMTEMMAIQDWDTDQVTVTVAETPSASWPAGSPLTLWATPLVVHADANIGDLQVTVRSRYNLSNGDVITFPVSSQINSLSERPVLIAQSGGASGDPDFPLLFTVNFTVPLPIPLVADTSPIYLRAYPGYLSQALTVPPLSSGGQMGPFLMDYVSSPLDAIPSYPETFSIRTLDGSSTPIQGTASSLITASKNFPIVNRPISAEAILFWKIKRGSGGFISPNKYRLISDDGGLARVSTPLVPAIPSGSSWQFTVTADCDGLLRFWTDTGGFQDYNLIAHQSTPIIFSTTSGTVINRFEILLNLSIPNTQVVISNSNFQGQNALYFQYALVAQVLGQTNYQATSVIIKPYFLSLADLTGSYDSGKTYNGGMIYL
jgi:hypothetical protein